MGISEGLKSDSTMPLLQGGLIGAGALTMLGTGSIPKYGNVSRIAENFCNRVNFITDISSEDKEKIVDIKQGIIFTNHPSKNMADFPAWMRYLNSSSRIRVGTGVTVTPMYNALLPNSESFLAEYRKGRSQDREKINTGIQDSINFVNSLSGLLILPYFDKIGAVHRRILEGVDDSTPIIEINSRFPEVISYPKMYGRIGKGILGLIPFVRGNQPMHIGVGVEEKTKEQLGNR